MNPYVSVFSSTAITVGSNQRKRQVGRDTHKDILIRLPDILGRCVSKYVHVLPLAIRVECYTIDGTKMTFDPSKLLFIGSMKEPKNREAFNM